MCSTRVCVYTLARARVHCKRCICRHRFIVEWGPVNGLREDDSCGMCWRIMALPEMTIEYVHRCFLDWLPEFYKKHDVPLLERPAAIKLTYFRRFFGRHWKHEQGARIQLLHKGECPPPLPSV